MTDPQPTREAVQFMHDCMPIGVPRNDAVARCLDRFAAQHSTAAPVIRAARKMQAYRYGDDTIDAAKAANELDIALAELDGSWHEPPVTAATVSGDARERAIDTLTNLLIDPLTDERDHPGIGAAIIALRADARRGEGGTRKPRAP